MKDKGRVVAILFAMLIGGISCQQSEEGSSGYPLINLSKVSEIPIKFGEGENQYFIHIDDLVCDDENNLYVVDIGWNRIFKFDPQNRFLSEFGNTGQGPGEFQGQPQTNPLSISFGNDHKLYIFDSNSQRISIFSKDGRFLGLWKPRRRIPDPPVINSRGEFFVACPEDKYVLERTNPQGDNLGYLLEYKEFYRYALDPEPKNFPRTVSRLKLLKTIGPDDRLYVISNLSLTVYIYEDDGSLQRKFTVDDQRLLQDLRIRLKDAVSWGRFASAFMDVGIEPQTKDLLLFYYNRTLTKFEVYRYDEGGTLHAVYVVPDRCDRFFAVGGSHSLYAVSDTGSVVRYLMPQNAEE